MLPPLRPLLQQLVMTACSLPLGAARRSQAAAAHACNRQQQQQPPPLTSPCATAAPTRRFAKSKKPPVRSTTFNEGNKLQVVLPGSGQEYHAGALSMGSVAASGGRGASRGGELHSPFASVPSSPSGPAPASTMALHHHHHHHKPSPAAAAAGSAGPPIWEL
jgi:hypothetical protein